MDKDMDLSLFFSAYAKQNGVKSYGKDYTDLDLYKQKGDCTQQLSLRYKEQDKDLDYFEINSSVSFNLYDFDGDEIGYGTIPMNKLSALVHLVNALGFEFKPNLQ